MEATATVKPLFPETRAQLERTRPPGQVLKWVGNKFRYAEAIASHFPNEFGTYYEPFVGTGSVLATLAPREAVASDTLGVLVDLLTQVRDDPAPLIEHYDEQRQLLVDLGRDAYEEIKARFNGNPTPGDLLVVSRSCYGGVVRFTRSGYFSTPMGPHTPMPTEKLRAHVLNWQIRFAGTDFRRMDFSQTMAQADEGDLVYCDPPYLHGQSILYGAQDFRLQDLWSATAAAARRGARVAVSVDGYRKSGNKFVDLGIPDGVFSRELLVERGGCMLRRFQLGGSDTIHEKVADRLLLTW